MRDSRHAVIIAVGGLIVPLLLAWWVHESQWAALLIVSAPWLNWSIYTIGALCGAVLAVLGSYMLRSYWLLIAALGAFYWAAGCMIGGLQSGDAPLISPAIALPYIRGMWILGGAALMISTIAVLKCVVRIVPPEELSRGLDTNDTNIAA